MSKIQGFSLVEVLLASALFFMIISIGGNFSLNSITREADDQLESLVYDAIWLARQNTIANQASHDQWGVYFDQDELIIFSGSDYASRNPANDEIFIYPNDYEKQSNYEIVFDALTHEMGQQSLEFISAVSVPIVIEINTYGLEK